jgi:hypothetical protein
MHPPYGWLSIDEAGSGQRMAPLPQLGPRRHDSSCPTAGSEVAGRHGIEGGEVNRGMIGAIIGILVIIILVIVILQMT